MVLFGQSLESDPTWVGENVDHKHTYTFYNIAHPRCQVCAKVSPLMGEGEGGGDYVPEFQGFLSLSPLTPPLSRKGRGSFRMDINYLAHSQQNRLIHKHNP